MVKDGQGWSRMVKDDQGWSRMIKDGQGWSISSRSSEESTRYTMEYFESRRGR